MRIILNITVFLLIFSGLYSEPFTNKGIPFVKHYSSFCSDSDKQNWAIAQAPNGIMYFGNSRGLLQYNSEKWELYKVNGLSAVSSIYIDNKGVIYVGATNEFGYFTVSEFDKLKYTNILDHTEQGDLGVVWDIIDYHGALYFISDNNRIFRFFNNEILELTVPPAFKQFRGFIVDNNFFLFDMQAGLGIVINNNIFRYHNQTFTKNIIVNALVRLDNKIVICTQENGLFTFDLNQNKHLNYAFSHTTETTKADFDKIKNDRNDLYYNQLNILINNQLIDSDLTHLNKLSNGKVVISTLKKGVFILDSSGNFNDNFYYRRGLADNSVFCTFEDIERNLWVATDQGLTIMEINSEFRIVNEEMGIEGAFLNIELVDNKLFVDTKTGLYLIDISDSDNQDLPELIVTKQSHRGNLYKYNKKGNISLIYNSLGVTNSYDIKTKQLTKLFSSPSNYAIAQYPADSSIFFFSDRNGLQIMKKRFENQWDFEFIGTILENQSEIRSLQFDSENILYVTDRYSGLSTVKFSDTQNLLKHTLISYNSKNNLPSISQNGGWFVTDNIILAGTSQGVYIVKNPEKAGTETLQFEPFTQINNHLDNLYISTIFIDNDIIFVGTKKGILSYNTKTQEVTKRSFYPFADREILCITKDFKNRLWVLCLDALICLDENSKHKTIHKPNLRFSKICIGKEFLLSPGTQENINAGEYEIEYNSIDISVAIPSYCISDNYTFSYFLEGFEEHWSDWTKDNNYSMSYLPAGKYTLWVKAKNTNDEEGNKISLKITILPNVYLSWWAYTIYILVLVAIIFGFIKLRYRWLREKNEKLETAVFLATEAIEQQKADVLLQKEQITRQRDSILLKNKQIEGSFAYARKIQKTIFKSTSHLNNIFKSNFVISMPKDIVSGDFYWCYQNADCKIVAVVDCTGHGIPGAFMSIMGINFLNKIVATKGIYMPKDILNTMRDYVIEALHQVQRNYLIRDGMDAAIITYLKKEKKLYYAGANNSILVSDDEGITKFPADKMPVGVHNVMEPFTQSTIKYVGSCNLYMYSDGYYDQFGHKSDKKMTMRKFIEHIWAIRDFEMEKQQESLISFFKNWQGDLIQTDDVLLIGFKVEHE